MKVKVGISNHHIHLTKEVYETLFHKENTPDFYLSQKGEYASVDFVTLKGHKGSISKVRVMGPNRNYNQVEISKSDAFILGLNPPIRKSGDLNGACDITVEYNGKEVLLKSCCILAQTHIHMNDNDALKYHLKDNDKVMIKIDKERKGFIEAFIKVKENGVLELHIDRDQANAFLLENNDEVEIVL